MPNWCDCDLYVRGRAGNLIRFMDMMGPQSEGESYLDMNKIIPYPEEYGSTDALIKEFGYMDWARLSVSERRDLDLPEKDGYGNGGYEWCINNWGTKWNFSEVVLDFPAELPNHLTFHFSTAWSPPSLVIKKLAEMFPELTFNLKFYESGMAFKGNYKWENGEMTEADDSKYSGMRGG